MIPEAVWVSDLGKLTLFLVGELLVLEIEITCSIIKILKHGQ